MPAGARILVVEDEGIVAIDLADTLGELGYEVIGIAASAEHAIARADALRPDLVLMDVRLGGAMDGIQAAAAIKETQEIPVIFLTAHSDDETLGRAIATSPHGYVVKPYSSPELRCVIELAIHKQQSERWLRDRERWLRTTMRSIGEGVVTTDAEQRVTFLNPVAEEMTGWSEKEAIGRNIDEVVTLVDERGATIASTLATTPRSHRDIYLRANDTTLPVDDNAAPIVDENGTLLGGVMVFRDVTEQRRIEDDIRRLNAELEQRVEERTRQLDDANQQLEAFNYSVAHDLRAPLRTIDGFSQILLEDHAGGLDEEARRLLERVRRNTTRMNDLIEDLLRLSRLGRCELRRRVVDLSQLASDVNVEIAGDRSSVVEIQAGVIASGDEGLLRIVLTNLFANAWKFTARTSQPRIAFGMDGAAYYVRDNGVGFDMTRVETMFGAFQRFHASAEFPGTGIGLAIVQRIIHRHGGRVWAVGAPDQGATFYFTLE